MGLTPATRWYKVRICRIKTHGSASRSEIGLWTKLVESSIADNSTTGAPTLDLIAGDCWLQYQLYNDLRSFPPRTLLMKLPCRMVCWRSQNPMADISTTTGPIVDPIADGCWARRELPNGIRYISGASELRRSLIVRVAFAMQVPGNPRTR